jgi:transcriptional regulator with XRE-family HTH domain/Zn-dependent peptidase ImmA (M78 family)
MVTALKPVSLDELGRRIEEARVAASLTQDQLALSAELDRTALSKIEHGRRRVDSLELTRIARALDRSVGWFISERPASVQSWRIARSLEPSDTPRSVWLLEELGSDINLLIELGMLDSPENLSPRPLGTEVEAEESATWVRKRLGMQTGPIDLLEAAEQLGMFVFVLSVDDAVDGAYFALERGGVCVINGQNDPGRRRFSLAHEIGHHLAQDPFVADWPIGGAVNDRERILDCFAAFLQLPRGVATMEWKRLSGRDNPRDATISLAASYRLSWSAACTHLRKLGLIADDDFSSILANRPTGADWLELGIRLHPEREAPIVPKSFGQAVIKAYRKYDLTAERAVGLLRGTVAEDELPLLAPVPLEALRAEL